LLLFFICVYCPDTRTCENCKQILEELEKIDDDADRYGVSFVKTSERGAAKKHAITTFPTLVYFRNKEPTIYEGIIIHSACIITRNDNK
jgi:hypothetical protein